MSSFITKLAERAKYYSLTFAVIMSPVIMFAATNDVAETTAPQKTSLFELVFLKGGVFMYM